MKLNVTYIFSLILLLLFACTKQASELHLPGSLAGVMMVSLDRNEIASQKLEKLHHGEDLGQIESVIGTYRNANTEIKIYVTLFESEEKSADMLNRMVESIQKEKSKEFTYSGMIEKQNIAIHTANSDSTANYFYADGDKNIWISTTPVVAKAVLDEFLNKFENHQE